MTTCCCTDPTGKSGYRIIDAGCRIHGLRFASDAISSVNGFDTMVEASRGKTNHTFRHSLDQLDGNWGR